MAKPPVVHPSILGPGALKVRTPEQLQKERDEIAALARGEKKPRKPRENPEHEGQVILFETMIPAHWNTHPELADAYANPNMGVMGGVHGMIWGKYFKREGKKAGVFDATLPHPRACWSALYLELKIVPNDLDDDQRDFQRRMNAAGNLAVVARERTPADLAVRAIGLMVAYLDMAHRNRIAGRLDALRVLETANGFWMPEGYKRTFTDIAVRSLK